MTRTSTFTVGVILVAWATELFGARTPDRATLLAMLEQRALTGIPRHLDHDEGEELQEAVTAALTNQSDGDVAWAAVRASFPIVPHVSPVIFDSMPTISVEDVPPLELPWKISADITLDASVDGADWRRAMDRTSRQSPIPIAKLFPRAARPGFHAVRFRATLRFNGRPAFVPASESRDLPALTYGITDSSAAGQRVAAILDAAARASASDFDRLLPQIPFGRWLATIASTPDGPPVAWIGQWCDGRELDDDARDTSICARTTVGSSPEGGHAEVWVKIATVDTSGAKPTWTAVTPTLEAVDLLNGGRASGDLATLPSALRSPADVWPHASLVLDSQAISVWPAVPKPGEPVTIAINVKNTGTSNLYGALIDVTVGDADDGPALAHRQFARSIPAGESVTVKMDARFPHGYGVVSALGVAGGHGMFPNLMIDERHSSVVANYLVRPDLAPPAFAARVAAAIGRSR